MASNTAEIALFLKQCHTTATVKTFIEIKNINLIDDASNERMLVYLPERIGTDINHYTDRYKIRLLETGEATLTAMQNDIITNINKLNLRQAVGTFTRPVTMLNIKYHHSNKIFEHKRTKVCEVDISIDVEWSVS